MKHKHYSERNGRASEPVELKVSGVMDMLEREFQVLTAIEQGKIIGGGSGSGGDYGSGGDMGSGGPGCNPLGESSMQFIKDAEGCIIGKTYLDAGKMAFGYGHDLSPEEIQQVQNGTFDFSQAHADALFQSDIEARENYVNSLITNSNITQGQYQTAIDIAFHDGMGALGSSNFLKDLNNGDYDAARNEVINWNLHDTSGQDVRIANELNWFDSDDPNCVIYGHDIHTEGWEEAHSSGN